MLFAISIIAITMASNRFRETVKPKRDTLLFVGVLVALFAAYYGSYYLLNADLF
jgi:hypothetical protein